MIPSVQEKRCSRCAEVKPARDFYACATSGTRLSTWCKPCQTQYYAKRKTDPDPNLSEKMCSNCKIISPISNFGVNRMSSTGYSYLCRSCYREGAKTRKERNPLVVRRSLWKQAIGVDGHIAATAYENALAIQRGRCAICQKEFDGKCKALLDHCHETGEIRGALCRKCNSGLGMFGDDLKIVARAADYLRAPPLR